MKSPIALLCSLLDDFSRLHPGVKGLERDKRTLKRRFKREGYGFLTIALPALDAAILHGYASGRFTCPRNFKKVPGGSIPRFLSGMICEIFEPVTGLLIESAEESVKLRDVHTFLKLYEKIQLEPQDEDKLHLKAIEEFYQCDESASQVVIPDRHNHHIGRVCRLILTSLETKDIYNETFKHGPGAVEEGFTSNQKWSEVYRRIGDDETFPEWTALLDFYNPERLLLCGYSGGVSMQTVPGGDFSPQGPWLASPPVVPTSGEPSTTVRPREACARLISVPKKSTSRRTITIEPVAKQFMQQGLNKVLRDSINECFILRECLALTRQEYNQKLALAGSLTGDWATIDLKSASDLLSLKLVESVFRHHPIFFGRMMDCRSPYVKCDEKSTLRLGKFAGMGNALTFPVQSICFAVIGIAAILDSQGLAPNYWNVKRASRLIRVYGDDIVVHSKYAHQVVDWISSVGLLVNRKKSFLTGNFRESCGVDAYKGVDITPIYLRYRPESIGESPKVCESLISTCNQMWLQGLYHASDCLKEHIESFLRMKLPLVSRESGAWGWHTRQEAVTPQKWCYNTHQFLTRTFALTAVKRRDKLDGYAALLKCLLRPIKEAKGSFVMPDILVHEKDHLDRTAIRHRVRLVRRWVPALVREQVKSS